MLPGSSAKQPAGQDKDHQTDANACPAERFLGQAGRRVEHKGEQERCQIARDANLPPPIIHHLRALFDHPSLDVYRYRSKGKEDNDNPEQTPDGQKGTAAAPAPGRQARLEVPRVRRAINAQLCSA